MKMMIDQRGIEGTIGVMKIRIPIQIQSTKK